jgi:hypothetical protein
VKVDAKIQHERSRGTRRKILISTQVPTAAAARAACGGRRLCSAAELRPTDGIAWAAGDCASCFSHIESCDATKEPWGADYFPLLTSSRKSTWLECRSARDGPRPQARACCCGAE